VSQNEEKVGKFGVEAQLLLPETPTTEWMFFNKLSLSNKMEFLRVPAGEFLMGNEAFQHIVNIPYDYWMAHYPITNEFYNFYTKAIRINHPVQNWKRKKDHPVVNVTWKNAMEYCVWLNETLKTELRNNLILRLPTEAEWEKAARGLDGRKYPWGNTFSKNKCNAEVGSKSETTPVGSYSPQGDSPYGCADMGGNVWEWTHSLDKGYPYDWKDGREDEQSSDRRVRRGGAYNSWGYAYCTDSLGYSAVESANNIGFRIIIAPSLSK
jgi:formylglycine-generating enzyme required for sulfatase activity